MQAMEISRTGMDVEWRRLEVIADNFANANTTRTSGGGPFKAMRLVSGPKVAFADHLQNRHAAQAAGVAVYGLEPIAGGAPRRVYEPSHPDADAQGFVSYPAFDQAGEMTLMIKTSRVYEANVVAMNIARQMYGKALEIGRRS
jgi:flagellar basal-body rod protein FlgC